MNWNDRFFLSLWSGLSENARQSTDRFSQSLQPNQIINAPFLIYVMRKKLTFTVIRVVQSVTYSNDRIISHCMYHCLQSVALFCFVRTKVVRHFRTHDLRSNSNIPFSNAWCSYISACKKQKCLTWVKHECVEAAHIKKNQTRPTADGNDDEHVRWHTNRHNHTTLLHTTITVVVAFNCFLLFSLFLSLLFFCAVLLLAFSKLCAPTTRNEWKQKYYGCFFFCCFVFRSLLLVGFLCTTVSLLFLKNINLLEYRVCIAHSSTELKPADQIAQLSKRMKHTVSAANRITRFWYVRQRKKKVFSFFPNAEEFIVLLCAIAASFFLSFFLFFFFSLHFFSCVRALAFACFLMTRFSKSIVLFHFSALFVFFPRLPIVHLLLFIRILAPLA